MRTSKSLLWFGLFGLVAILVVAAVAIRDDFHSQGMSWSASSVSFNIDAMTNAVRLEKLVVDMNGDESRGDKLLAMFVGGGPQKDPPTRLSMVDDTTGWIPLPRVYIGKNSVTLSGLPLANWDPAKGYQVTVVLVFETRILWLRNISAQAVKAWVDSTSSGENRTYKEEDFLLLE